MENVTTGLDLSGGLLEIPKGDKKVFVTKEDYDYLTTLIPEDDLNSGDWSSLESNPDKTNLVLALFTVNMYNDAWDTIENNLDNINYLEIKKCKYFRIDSERVNVFDYLYDNSIIDDKEYSYYNIINGALNPVFWNEYIEKNNCNSFTDICNLVNDAYNSLDKEDDCPIIQFGIYEESLMNKYLKDDEYLDDFVYDKPAFLFPIKVLYKLIDTNHFKNVNKILYIISNIVIDDSCTGDKDFWEYAVSKLDNNDGGFALSNTHILLSILDNASLFIKNAKTDLLLRFVINAQDTTMYIYTVANKLKEVGINLWDVKVVDYLEDSNMGLAPYYRICGMDTSGYKSIRSLTQSTYAVYNTETGTLLLGNSLYSADDFAELDIFQSFIDDPNYEYHEMSDYEKSIYNYCAEDKLIYDEFMYALNGVVETIKSSTKDE